MGSAQGLLAAACVQPTWIWHLERAAIHIYSLQGNCWPKFTRECKWMQMNAWNTKRSKEVEVTGSPRVHCPENSKVKLRVHSRRLQRSIFHCYICSPEGNPKLLVSICFNMFQCFQYSFRDAAGLQWTSLAPALARIRRSLASRMASHPVQPVAGSNRITAMVHISLGEKKTKSPLWLCFLLDP